MKTITIPIIKVALMGLLSLQSFNSSAADYFLDYSRSDDKIENTNTPASKTADSTDLTQHHKSIVLFSTTLIQENGEVKILWESELDVNNSFYTIERSLDAQNWEEINTVASAITSSQQQSYSFIDKFPFEGISYYRIKYTDFNGAYGYSRVEAIELILNKLEIQIYPQPADEYITLILSGFKEEKVELTILSSNGLTVKKSIQEFSGNQINVSDLNPGIYFIHIKTSEQSKVFRMIKK